MLLCPSSTANSSGPCIPLFAERLNKSSFPLNSNQLLYQILLNLTLSPDCCNSATLKWFSEVTLIHSQYCYLAARAWERCSYVLISIQLPAEWNPQHRTEMCSAQLQQQPHTSSPVPPLPQIKVSLEMPLCHTTFLLLGQHVGVHMAYTVSSPNARGAFSSSEKWIDTHRSKTKLVSGSRASLRDHRSRVQGKANTMSPGDMDSSHGTEVRAKIKNSSKGALLFSEENREVTSGQNKNSSSHRPISAQLGPVLPSKVDGGLDLRRVKKSPARKDDSHI